MRDTDLAFWLEKLSVGPNDVWDALAPFAGSALVPEVHQGLHGWSALHDAKVRKDFLDRAIEAAAAQPVDASIFQAVWTVNDQPVVAQKLAGLLSNTAAEDIERMRRIISIWVALGPMDNQPRTHFASG